MAGVDKLMVELGQRTILDRTLAAVADLPTVVVGPVRRTARQVRWTREVPAGAGPVAAIAAGLVVLPAEIDTVVLLAADLPGVGEATVARLAAALSATADDSGLVPPVGAVLRDDAGRIQWLTGVWRRAALASALPPDPAGVAVRAVLGGLPVIRLPAVAGEAVDVDTPADLAWWRDHLESQSQ